MRSSEQNERFEFSVAADAVSDPGGGLDQHYGTTCTFLDDFDAQVDFELIDWPAGNGMKLVFGAYFGEANDAFGAVNRQGRPGHGGGAEAYSADVRSSHGFVESSDMSGALRIAREHDILSLYFRGRQGWMQLASGYEPRFAILILDFNYVPERRRITP